MRHIFFAPCCWVVDAQSHAALIDAVKAIGGTYTGANILFAPFDNFAHDMRIGHMGARHADHIQLPGRNGVPRGCQLALTSYNGGGDNYNKYRPDGVPYTFVNNVAIASANIDAGNPRGFGMQFINTQSGGTASGNVVVNVSPNATANLFALSAAASFAQPTFLNWTNNIQWGWGKQTLASFTQDPGYGGIGAQIFITRTANVIDSENAGGSNLMAPATPFPDPNRSVASFATARGYASEEAFWTYVVQHPEVSWAKQIGDYIRAGFGR